MKLSELEEYYTLSTSEVSLMNRIRIYHNVTKWDKQEVNGCRKNLAHKAAIKYAYEISHTMDNIPDIIIKCSLIMSLFFFAFAENLEI